MTMSATEKKWIDSATYAELIQKVRGEPAASPWFVEDTGRYFFAKLREHVARRSQEDGRISAG